MDMVDSSVDSTPSAESRSPTRGTHPYTHPTLVVTRTHAAPMPEPRDTHLTQMQLASLTHGQTRETRAEDQALIRKLTLCERIHGTVSL